MKNIFILIIAVFAFSFQTIAQENYKTISKEDSAKYYFGSEKYEVIDYLDKSKKKKPKNVILMIGDGMGIAQVYAGITANGGKLNLNNFKNIGFSTTFSGDNFITDSGAAGTAIASSVKTYNNAIGVNMDTIAVENIREKCEKKGMATGVVSTSAVTHATPASFMAHQSNRSMYEEIAADFLKTDVDVFIGGGLKHFTKRADGNDLTKILVEKGYQLETTIEEAAKVKSGKLAALLAFEHIKKMSDGRGDMLPIATTTAIEILNNDKDGFFMMVEGSQIDWGGHQNNTTYIVEEMLDFDRSIGAALAFAAGNKETLIIVTADHETGGMSINGGSLETGDLRSGYTTGGHSGIMTPVFAFGPGSENFKGIYDNTDISKKIWDLLK